MTRAQELQLAVARSEIRVDYTRKELERFVAGKSAEKDARQVCLTGISGRLLLGASPVQPLLP